MLHVNKVKCDAHDTGDLRAQHASEMVSVSDAARPAQVLGTAPAIAQPDPLRSAIDSPSTEDVRATCLACRQLVLVGRGGAIRGPGEDEIEELCEQLTWEQVTLEGLDPTAPMQWFAGPGPHSCSDRERDGALACWDRLQGDEWPAPERRATRALVAVHHSELKGRLIVGSMIDGRLIVEE